ncbi:hypothetical protein BDZ91DRAFT_796720 [Kalaharituber pfeilii]|nr:hypothetical protein BDZ91DRAFT_796720 [Kalaharituber pfeilii]
MASVTYFKNPLDGSRTWVKFHPKDNLIGLHPSYLTNPGTFKPRIHADTNKIEAWGIDDMVEPSTECEMNLAIARLLHRMQTTQSLYVGMDTPETAFVKKLMAIKEKKLALQKAAADARKQCDYLLRIVLSRIPDPQGNDLIYRCIKVSGGMNLNVFQDKILQPVMGW